MPNPDLLIQESLDTAVPRILAQVVEQLKQSPSDFRPNDPRLKLRALILTHDRNSAQAIDYEIQKYLKNTSMHSLLVDGTLKKVTQFSAFRNKTDILISTPAYLPRFVEKEALNIQHLQYLVVVGVDKIFNHGYEESIEKLLAWMPWERQNIAISETLPYAVSDFAYSFLKIDRPLETRPTPVESFARDDRSGRPDRGPRREGRRDSRGPRNDRRDSRGPRSDRRDDRPPREGRDPNTSRSGMNQPGFAPRPAAKPAREFTPTPMAKHDPQSNNRKDNNRSSYKNRHHQDRYLDAFSGMDKILEKPPVAKPSAHTPTPKNSGQQPAAQAPQKKSLLTRFNPLKWMGPKRKDTPKPQNPSTK